MWVFESVYAEHFQAVFRFALRNTGRRDWAEDITSETFLALYRQRDNVSREQLPAWLFTVARNRAIDYWRRRSKEEELEIGSLEISSMNQTSQSPLDLEYFDELLQDESLKPAHRVCLVMRFVHGMSREEIAKDLGWKESQVKGYLQYGLKLLRKSIDRKNYGERARASKK